MNQIWFCKEINLKTHTLIVKIRGNQIGILLCFCCSSNSRKIPIFDYCDSMKTYWVIEFLASQFGPDVKAQIAQALMKNWQTIINDEWSTMFEMDFNTVVTDRKHANMKWERKSPFCLNTFGSCESCIKWNIQKQSLNATNYQSHVCANSVALKIFKSPLNWIWRVSSSTVKL